MWIVSTLVGFAVLAWLGYSWMSALFAKYRHTRESATAIVLIGAGSLYSGWKTATSIAPGWSFGPKAAIAFGVGFTLFSVFTFIAVNMWTALLARHFDEEAARLDDEEDSILRNLQAMRWESYKSAEGRDEVEPRDEARRTDPKEDLRRAVEVWEQGGGAARIRSLKVLEWREEFSCKPAHDVRDDIRSFEIEISMETDEARKDQIRARLALATLALLEKEPPAPERAARKPSKPEIGADEAAMRRRLQEIHSELQAVKSAKTQYLRSKVKLGWRSGE